MAIEIPRLAHDANALQSMIWLRNAVKIIGPGFHPDTPAEEYIDLSTDQPTFTAAAAQIFNDDHEKAFSLLVAANRDPYAIGGRVARRMLGIRLEH